MVELLVHLDHVAAEVGHRVVLATSIVSEPGAAARAASELPAAS